MTNRYRNTPLPAWVANASKEQLIEHIQYLTHNQQTAKKALAKARRRYRKAEAELTAAKPINQPNP